MDFSDIWFKKIKKNPTKTPDTIPLPFYGIPDGWDQAQSRTEVAGQISVCAEADEAVQGQVCAELPYHTL